MEKNNANFANKNNCIKYEQAGFTLMELSIIIIIVGLLVAGVVSGKSLVRHAKVKTVIIDYNKYIIAVDSFENEYKALPGDFKQANDYGIGNSGNGDYRIFHENSETWYAWQHLGNAGLIEGSFSGDDAGDPDLQIGVNVPSVAFGESVIGIFSYLTDTVFEGDDNCLSTHTDPLFGIHTGFNVLSFGKLETIHDNCPILPFLKVVEAHGIDKKIDDGIADSGKMFSANEADTNTNGDRCVNNNVRGTGGANYDFDEKGVVCRLIFKID